MDFTRNQRVRKITKISLKRISEKFRLNIPLLTDKAGNKFQKGLKKGHFLKKVGNN
jgi:hypothetical protein